MAGLSAPSALHVSGYCVAVTEGEKDGEALITLGRSVEVYNIHDNRCVRSWPLVSTDQLTCPALFHSSAKTYCAVRNNNELLIWKSEDQTLSSSTHLHFSSVPLFLLAPSSPDRLISVCSTGTVTMVTTTDGGDGVAGVLSEVVLGGGRRRGMSVIGSVVEEVGGCESVVVMCEDGEVFVCRIDQSDLVLITSLNLGSKVVKGSMCVCGDELVFAGLNGTISVHSLTSSSSSSSSSSTRHLTTTGSTPSHTPYKLAAVSTNQFVVADQVGGVSLRDSIYGTLQISVECNLGRLATVWCIWGHIVMCGEEGGVSVSRVMGVGGALLAAALGRKTTPPTEPTEVWREDTGEHWSWRSEIAGTEESSLLTKLCDPQQTPSLESLAAQFPASLSLPPPSYWPLVRRLTKEKRFWPRDQLAELVKAGAVGGSEAEELVERALEVKDWSLLHLIINCSQNLPETVIVSLLHHALELPEEVESNGERLKREKLLWKVLALPYSDSLLQQPLSQLPLSSVVLLLQFLTPHISVVSLSCPPPLPYPQLLDWLAILLDTHWPSLSLSPAAKQLLRNFKHTTYHQMLVCENLATVKNMLEAGKRRKAATTNSPHGLKHNQPFTTERLKLKI